HRQSRFMKFREIGGATIREDYAAKPAVVGFAHGGIDADLSRHATDEQRADRAVAQHQLKIGLVEGALARLINHRLTGKRIEFRNDVVARLAADENSAHWTRRTDTQGRISALHFQGRSIRKIGTMTLAGVYDQHVGAACSREHRPAGSDRSLKP